MSCPVLLVANQTCTNDQVSRISKLMAFKYKISRSLYYTVNSWISNLSSENLKISNNLLVLSAHWLDSIQADFQLAEILDETSVICSIYLKRLPLALA